MDDDDLTARGIERVLERGWVVTDSGCWEYSGARLTTGYGCVTLSLGRRGLNRQLKAHRLSYLHHVGPIPEGVNVLHSCDNPPCVNPAHLSLGTIAENNSQRKERGRGADRKGSANPLSKLTEDKVLAIKREYLDSDGRVTQRELGERYGVSQTTIYEILNGRLWTHIHA